MSNLCNLESTLPLEYMNKTELEEIDEDLDFYLNKLYCLSFDLRYKRIDCSEAIFQFFDIAIKDFDKKEISKLTINNKLILDINKLNKTELRLTNANCYIPLEDNNIDYLLDKYIIILDSCRDSIEVFIEDYKKQESNIIIYFFIRVFIYEYIRLLFRINSYINNYKPI